MLRAKQYRFSTHKQVKPSLMQLTWSSITTVTSRLLSSFSWAIGGCCSELGHSTYSCMFPCKLLFFTPDLLPFGVVC